MKKYSIEQFPKNKDITNLSPKQWVIRAKKKVKFEEKKTCITCGKEQPIDEFYLRNYKDKKSTRRKTCRDCLLKRAGVVEIGKLRYAKKIMDKGFRRCSVCKETKPITAYNRYKKGYKGYANNCYECQHSLVHDYQKKQKEDIGLFYVKQYALRKYGIKKLDKKSIEKYRKEIIETRKDKFFLDGQSFLNVSDFARYVEKTYKISEDAVIFRVRQGYTEQECTMSESEARSKAYTKGRIKVTDTITNEVFWFANTQDVGLIKMFSDSAIQRCIKTGGKTKITGLSKYKNPCTIERVK